MKNLIESSGWRVVVCSCLKDARRLLRSDQPLDLLLADYRLPDGNAEELLGLCGQRGNMPLTVVVTSFPDAERAVAMTRDGLFDYLRKPFVPDDLGKILRRAQLCRAALDREGLVARSEAMRRAVHQVHLVARNQHTSLLLTGETGTGKDVLARYFHHISHRDMDDGKWVDVNCAALPGDLLEAELFGSERGAYTGAHQKRVGLIEQAQGGTIFLDEIGELPLLQQAKFLRFLETRSFRRLGGDQVIHFNGRIVAATNRHIPREVTLGRFREDLWFRLSAFQVEIPPLRERKEDLPDLVRMLLSRLSVDLGRRYVPRLKPEDLILMQQYEFPGNIRELRNLLKRSLISQPEDVEMLVLQPWLPGSARSSVPQAGGEQKISVGGGGAWMENALAQAPPMKVLRWATEHLVAEALRRHGGNLAATCRYLGISREQITRVLQDMDSTLRETLPRLPRGRPRKMT